MLGGLLPKHNTRFAVTVGVTTDCLRSLGRGFELASILSVRHERVVSDDDVVRRAKRRYQMRPPWGCGAGEWGSRIDGTER